MLECCLLFLGPVFTVVYRYICSISSVPAVALVTVFLFWQAFLGFLNNFASFLSMFLWDFIFLSVMLPGHWKRKKKLHHIYFQSRWNDFSLINKVVPSSEMLLKQKSVLIYWWNYPFSSYYMVFIAFYITIYEAG